MHDIFGAPLIQVGEVRDGGSYEQRMSHITVWNSVMDEHNYLTRRWQDAIKQKWPVISRNKKLAEDGVRPGVPYPQVSINTLGRYK